MSSVASRTTTHISVKGINNFFPYYPSNLVSSQTNSPIRPKIDLDISSPSFIQHLSEIRHLDNRELIRPIKATTDKYLTELKPNGVSQLSAGERLRVERKGKDGRSSNTNSTETTSSSGSHARAVGKNTEELATANKGEQQKDDD